MSLLRLDLRIVIPAKACPVGCLLAALLLPHGAQLSAQGRGLDFSYGRWWRDGTAAETYTLTFRRPLFGPFSYGIGVTHLDDQRAVTDRTQSGGEFSLGVGNDGKGLYGLGSGGLAMRHTDGSVDANWAAGAGYVLRPLSFLSIGAAIVFMGIYPKPVLERMEPAVDALIEHVAQHVDDFEEPRADVLVFTGADNPEDSDEDHGGDE